jgi:polyisoprenoid-binding protein YceI
MTRRRLFLKLMLVLAAAAAGASEMIIESDQVLVTWQATRGGKQISGVSRSLEWSLLTLESGQARVQLRVPVDSFDSGHGEADSLLRASAESARYPFVEVEGMVREERFEGTVSLHGRTRPLVTSVSVARSEGQLTTHTSFSIALDEFGIEVPGVDNRVAVEFDARLLRNPLAVISVGTVGSN